MAVNFPTVGPGLTPRSMKSAAKQFIKDELAMTAQREADKVELKKSYKESKKLRATETDIADELLEDVFEGEDGAVVDEDGNDFVGLEEKDDEEEDEEEGDDGDYGDEEDISDEEDEASDEDDDDDEASDEDDDILDEEDMSDDEDAMLDEEEEKEVVAPKLVASKPIAKVHKLQLTRFFGNG